MLLKDGKLKTYPKKKVSDVIWDEILIAFEKTKEGLFFKTGMEWSRRVDRFREVMNKKPTPTSGEDFVKKYTKNFFDDISSGSDSRKRYLDSVYKILEYGVNRYGMSERWLPPHKDLAKELFGDNTRTTEDTVTPPISDADLTILLDTLKATNPNLYLAAGLIALHGLRLSELATLELREDNKLFVGSIKKNVQNKGTKNPPLRVFALDILGREGLGNELVVQYKNRLVGLPVAIKNQFKMVQKKEDLRMLVQH